MKRKGEDNESDGNIIMKWFVQLLILQFFFGLVYLLDRLCNHTSRTNDPWCLASLLDVSY